MSFYEIVADFPRPDPSLIERANGLYFCIVGCRIGPRYVMDTGIKPLDEDWRICGPALTVRPEKSDDVFMAHLAGKYVKPGDVVVIDAAGDTRAACLGASISNGFMEMGATGIVADGYILTAEVIRKREGVPVFSRGTISRSNTPESPGWINTPVICGGMIVHPGDLILGDEDGVVVVPRARIEEIIDFVEDKGSFRPLDGHIPPRDPVDRPYYQRSGAEEKLGHMPDIKLS